MPEIKNYNKVIVVARIGDFNQNLEFYKKINATSQQQAVNVYNNESYNATGYIGVSFNSGTVAIANQQITGWELKSKFCVVGIYGCF